MPNQTVVEEPEDALLVDARPEKRFFISMLIKDIELIPAMVDLVDNSVDGARSERGDAEFEGLWVNLSVGREEFVIRDNCGGISTGLARRYAFRFGRPSDFDGIRGSVGQFGVGMKRALFKLGRWFEIESRTRSTYFLLQQDVDEWATEEDADWTFKFTQADDSYELADGEDVGTSITVRRLHETVAEDLGRSGTVSRLRADLQMRHQRAIAQGMRITLNGENLASRNPTLLASPEFKPIKRRMSISANGSALSVELMAGIIRGQDPDRDDGEAEEFQRPGDAGWYLFCNGRLVFAADRSRLTGWGTVAAAYHPQYRNFRGYVFMTADDSALLPWNTTKTGVDEDSLVFRRVQTEMEAALKRVQTVINRLKKERQEQDSKHRPLLAVVERASETPLDALEESDVMIVPPALPTPPARRQRIVYDVDREEFNRVGEVLGVDAPGDVGRGTFDFYLRTQVQ